MYRHGDVLIVPVQETPARKGRQYLDHLTLAEGEVTGHSHQILDKKAARMYQQAGTTYLSVKKKKGADLSHEEHATIKLPKGTYAIIQQREWTPEGDRRVAD